MVPPGNCSSFVLFFFRVFRVFRGDNSSRLSPARIHPAFRETRTMNRRQFLQAGAAGLALSHTAGYAAEFADDKPKRVGIIGPGWYGKIDLIRLIQVAPVEVVSLCDVNRRALDDAAGIIAARQP